MKGSVYFAPAEGRTLMSKTRLFLELHRPNPGVDDVDNIRTLRQDAWRETSAQLENLRRMVVKLWDYAEWWSIAKSLHGQAFPMSMQTFFLEEHSRELLMSKNDFSRGILGIR
ncbi:hypothetical protein B0H14DRAFT_3457592 [Mycena olivaceomarginata]|nr:hypothetical protein B0H14DRAFT_3457592 [Mycena olivaceomarginata]